MKKKMVAGLMSIGLALASGVSVAQASVISWADWTATAPSKVFGTLNVNGTSVDITFSGPYYFAQTNGGTNYWNPSAPYVSSAVDNAPPASDIIALSAGGSKTISFSQVVQDPVIALVSWNGNTVDFGVPIEILSYGHGYWGNGTPILNASGTGFYGSGEVHGVIRLPGAYSSITFTDTSEYWHGFTVGVSSLHSSPVPEPATVFIWGAGLVGLVTARIRIRRKKTQ